MRLLSGPAELASFVRHPRSQPTYLGYTNGFVYGFGMSGLMLLVPLYVLSLDFNLADLGFIVAAPAFFMIPMRLPGGAVSDRFGEKVILRFSFLMFVASALIAAHSSTIWPLFAAQLFNGASRSVYWSAGQSYISRSSPGESGKVMGRQLSFESTGGIIGAIATGFFAQVYGFQAAFIMTAAASAFGFLITSSLPPLPRKDQARSFMKSFAPARQMLFKRTLLHAHMVAFMAASYAGLMGGLFIAFLRDIGYTEGETGVIRSLSSISLAGLAFVFGSILSRFGSRNMALTGISLTGLLAIAIAASGNVPILPVVFMTLTGMTFGSLRALYPTLAADNSTPAQRGLALSVVSLYWAIAMLLSPLVFGYIAHATSLQAAIYLFGAFCATAGLLSPILYAYGRAGLEGGEEESEETAPAKA